MYIAAVWRIERSHSFLCNLIHVRCAMQVRFVSTASAQLQASNMQLGRILNKVMQRDRTKRNRSEPVRSVPASCAAATSRRVTILNKVFMKYITDLMATGEVASNLVGKGIEISHVNFAPDFSTVNVYWFGNADKSVEKILQVSAGHLQHELSQLRVIGLVPPIRFVKNKQYTVGKEVEDRLATVDLGQDHVPTAHIASARAPILETSLSARLRARIISVDGQLNEATSCEVPEMRQDVMGLDHATVMKKIKNSVKRSRVAEQGVPSSEPQGHYTSAAAAAAASPGQVVDLLSSKEQGKLFGEFLKKRTIEEKRRQRLVPLIEVKMQEERDWVERMRGDEDDDDDEEGNIKEPYRDEYDAR